MNTLGSIKQDRIVSILEVNCHLLPLACQTPSVQEALQSLGFVTRFSIYSTFPRQADNIWKNPLPFCSTLALIAISRPMASGLQIGGHGRVNRKIKISYKGKKKKLNSSVSNQVHNSPLKLLNYSQICS